MEHSSSFGKVASRSGAVKLRSPKFWIVEKLSQKLHWKTFFYSERKNPNVVRNVQKKLKFREPKIFSVGKLQLSVGIPSEICNFLPAYFFHPRHSCQQRLISVIAVQGIDVKETF